MFSSWTTPAANGSPIAAGSAPSSRMSCRAPHATCSPQRSTGWNRAASLSCFTVTTKSTIEVPAESLSDAEFLAILLELPDWASGLPARRQGALGAHYLEAARAPGGPDRACSRSRRRGAARGRASTRSRRHIDEDIGPIDDPARVEREDDAEFVANLPDHVAPLTETGRAAALVRQQGRLPVSRGRRAVLHHLS